MRYVLLYDVAADGLAKAETHYPAHVARLTEFHDRGVLVAVGPFGNVQDEGSMAIFTTREAAQQFVDDDPFVVNGVVARWQLREWDDMYAS